MNIIEQELNVIKEYLENCVSTPFLEENLTTFLTKGAKFIRSSLAILYLKSQGKVIDENIYKILVAGELIHSASLLHDDVIDEAVSKNANLIISHHPVIFRPVKQLSMKNPAVKMVSHGISAICVHTPIDMAVGGINDIIVDMLSKSFKLK